MTTNLAPALLIIEHPRAHLTEGELAKIEAEFSSTRYWILRIAGRPSLGATTFFYRQLGNDALFDVLPDDVGDLHIALVGFGEDEPLPLGWVRHLAALRVRAMRRVVPAEGNGNAEITEEQRGIELIDHQPMYQVRSDVLLVFPGPIVPTVMGAHQRAFGVLEALVRDGIPCDVLVTCSQPSDTDRAQSVLSQLCASVHVNGRSGRKLPPHLIVRKGVESGLRWALGFKQPAPRLFEERLHTAAAFSGCVMLRRLLESGRYRTIMISYAWMEPIRALLPPPLIEQHHWICDTHDVNFIRTKTHNEGEVRFCAFERRERRIELEVLRKFDQVLAISPSDAKVLRAHLSNDRVLEVPAGFEYALQEPRVPHPEALVFGFIGGEMDANVKAVKKVLEAWWPAIVARWPAARLRVAGNIASVPGIANAAFTLRGVEMFGYVNSLRSFYRSIDVLLNPVVVQGGLNFKAVESLMAGRLLVTTPLGARCLGDTNLAAVASSAAEVVALLEREFADPTEVAGRRAETTAATRKRFGNRVAYEPLLALLKENLPKRLTRAPNSGPLRVLMQVGDHFENWARTVGLAMAIRERGHHPIALVYGKEGYNFFLANGVDVVSLFQYSEPAATKAARNLWYRAYKTRVPKFYCHFDLDDLVVGPGASNSWSDQRALAFRNNAISHIHRGNRLMDSVRPDVLLVWNGYTGITANILRQVASIRGLGVAFMERSLLDGAVYVDRRGVNGYSQLCACPMHRIMAHHSIKDGASLCRAALREVDAIAVEELRRAGPWHVASKIVFVPLQVESDTNLLLHSPDVDSMGKLVQTVWDRHHNAQTAIVVRPHPEETEQVHLPTLPGVYLDSEGDLHAWLELADLVVTVNSTVGLHALLRGRAVSALGQSIYSGKGLTDGNTSDRRKVDAFASYLIDVHTGCGRGLPKDLESLLPSRERPGTWRTVNCAVSDVLGWWKRWHDFAVLVGENAKRTGVLSIETDVRPDDTIDLTYRTLRVPLTREWLESRAREVFTLDPATQVEVIRAEKLAARATSTPLRLFVSRSPRAPGDYVLDKYLAPWVTGSR